MFKIIEEFIEQPSNNRLIKYTGAISAISGLFLGISEPTTNVNDARVALLIIQLFWLVLLTIMLTSLFINFTKFCWKKERRMLSLYQVPHAGIFSFFLGLILTIIVLNLWRYMISFYTDIFAEFAVMMMLPILALLGFTLLEVFIKKRETKIPLIIVVTVDSITIGTLMGIAGFYIQGVISQTYYLQWLYEVSPVVIVMVFLYFICLIDYKKYNLFKPLSTKTYEQ